MLCELGVWSASNSQLSHLTPQGVSLGACVCEREGGVAVAVGCLLVQVDADSVAVSQCRSAAVVGFSRPVLLSRPLGR